MSKVLGIKWTQDSIGLARRLHAIFTNLGIQYYVTDGVASTTYGEPRFTIDLDLVINVSDVDLYPLIAALEADGFYVPGVEDVVSERMQTLQITDQETIERADMVIAGIEVFEREKLNYASVIYPNPSLQQRDRNLNSTSRPWILGA